VTVDWQVRPAPGGDVEAIVRPVYAGLAGQVLGALSAAFLSGAGFTGAVGDVLAVPGAPGEPVTVLLGLGPDPSVVAGPEQPTGLELGTEPGSGPGPGPGGAGATERGAAIRTAAAHLARATASYRRLAICAPSADVGPLAEGYLLGGYRFPGYRSTPRETVDQRIDVVAPDAVGTAGAAGVGGAVGAGGVPMTMAALAQGLARGQVMGAAVLLARDLVNEPGGALTPTGFAERALAVADASGLGCEVWDAERITAERLGGLLGVARGSLEPPRLVKLSYRPGHPGQPTPPGQSAPPGQPVRPGQSGSHLQRIALVGKGVTYDAGGISLKPNAQLADMKADMAGAAAVLGAMSALAGLDCQVAVDGWLPLTENMINANPVRVGDVLVTRSGTTVEVRNADAEGRLILADALDLAGETRPDAIIDVATLTDAAAIALGRKIAAVMGNDNALAERLRAAGERAGEPVWPLPLPDRYRRQLRSQVADLVNYTIGTRHGTALLAGLFLREFVPPGIAWAHLDIQGTALCDADDGEWVAGATGFGVRLLAELLTSWPT
jgi:leucyl aminopeptidase